MPIQVIMPQMGESVLEGTITKWLKNVGDAVTRDEPLFEISTDKVDSEIPSPASGILTSILVPAGRTIQINTVLAIIDGDRVPEEREAASRESKPEAGDQATVPLDSKELSKRDARVPPSTVKPEEPRPPAMPIQASTESMPGIRIQDIRTSPLVRRLARENNVDLSKVRGTGLEGRITKDDLLAYLGQRPSSPPSQMPVIPAKEPVPEALGSVTLIAPEPPASVDSSILQKLRFVGESEIVPMSAMRKAIAEHMILSRRTSAHVSTVFEVDVSAVVQLRETHKAEFEMRESIPLTYTPFFAKALVDTVREFPILNSSVVGENIVYKKPINLGVAVALEAGLIVPVVKDAQLKSFTGLALEIHDLAERARNKKLKPEEVQSGTITITNPGSYGALFNTPIISQPQVAILGVGGIEKRPVVINDAIAIRSMVCLSLAFDHRVIDGSVADRFMAKLKDKLQLWTQWID